MRPILTWRSRLIGRRKILEEEVDFDRVVSILKEQPQNNRGVFNFNTFSFNPSSDNAKISDMLNELYRHMFPFYAVSGGKDAPMRNYTEGTHLVFQKRDREHHYIMLNHGENCIFGNEIQGKKYPLTRAKILFSNIAPSP